LLCAYLAGAAKVAQALALPAVLRALALPAVLRALALPAVLRALDGPRSHLTPSSERRCHLLNPEHICLLSFFCEGR